MSAFDAEMNVLGGCLLAPQAYWQVADLIDAQDFSRDATRNLWLAIMDTVKSGSDVDVFTVGDRDPRVAVFAAECANATPGVSAIRAYAEVVQRNAITRRLRASGERIARLSGRDALGEAQRIIASCAPKVASAIKPAKDFLRESIARMQERCDATDILTGVPTSLDALDDLTAGWQPGDLIFIGARPSVGKTALALQCAVAAARSAHPVLILSMEMTGSQLTDRLIANIGKIDSKSVRQPKQIDDAGWNCVLRASEVLGMLPMFIDDTPALRMEDVGARVRQANATQRLGLVVVDYLTMMYPPKADTMAMAWQGVTRGLKVLAKELQVPLLTLSQFNRDGQGAPSLTSFRDTGAIEQDADVAILLDRPDAQNHALIHLIVAKQRNGPVGDMWLHFDGATQTFTPTDERPTVAAPASRYGRGMPRREIA